MPRATTVQYDWENMTLPETRGALSKLVAELIREYAKGLSLSSIETRVKEEFKYPQELTLTDSIGHAFMGMAYYEGAETEKRGEIIDF